MIWIVTLAIAGVGFGWAKVRRERKTSSAAR
jgi:hypothetical protein